MQITYMPNGFKLRSYEIHALGCKKDRSSSIKYIRDYIQR